MLHNESSPNHYWSIPDFQGCPPTITPHARKAYETTS